MANQVEKTTLSPREISAFCTQMSLLVKAGISVQEGIGIMCEDAQSKVEKELLEQILLLVEEGRPLAFALEQTGCFPKYMIDMLEIGETAGRLEEVLDSLTEYYERSQAISKSIRSAVTYPIIMIVMMAVVIGVLVIKVLPIFRQVFAQLGTELSAFSQNVMQFGSVAGAAAGVIIALILLLILAMMVMRTSKKGRESLSHLFSVLPGTRSLSEKISSGRFASAMALMLSSGLDTDQSLEMAQQLIEDPRMQQKVSSLKQHLEDGQSFPEALASTAIFSGVYARMVVVGFRTGAVDAVMSKIARNYEDEVNDKISSIISILEPTLVAILSVIVGMILLSVMLPLMGIMSSIG